MKFLENISAIEGVVKKGQPFAKRNKDRRIRKELRNIRTWENNLIFKDVWGMFWLWVAKRVRILRKTTG